MFQGLNSCTVNFASEGSSAWAGKAIRTDVGSVGGVGAVYNVTIDLRRRVGRWLNVELEFNSTWLLLSEVTFNSGKHIFLKSEYLKSNKSTTKMQCWLIIWECYMFCRIYQS